MNDILERIEITKIAITKNEKTALGELAMYEKEIEVLLEMQTQSAAFRSKAKIAREFEKNSKYFFSLEKSNYNKKMMHRIRCPNGSYTTCPNKILELQRGFYKELFTADEKVQFKLVNETDDKLSNVEKESMEQEISLEELDTAVKGLKKEKTPGNTGFTAEFYQFFWQKIRKMYYNALMYAKGKGEFHLSA